MVLTQEYFEITEELISKYGNKSIVLMQVGSFFEVYGFRNKTTQEIYKTALVDFVRICGFENLSVKKTTWQPRGVEILMSGFPEYMIEKYANILQDNGYTCAIHRQDSNTKNTTRSLDIICSPGTHFNTEATILTNNIMCIWIYNRPPSRLHTQAQIIFGMSNVDVLNGSSHYNEICENYYHSPTIFDEIERYYSIYQPNEMLFVYNSTTFKTTELNSIIQYINISSKTIHRIDINDDSNSLSISAKQCEKISYQSEIFKQFFEITDINSFKEVNKFNQYHIGSQSYCYLLNFIYAHNPNLLNRINQPSMEIYNDRLILANHSLNQLNIINNARHNKKFGSVVSMLNCAITPMGKRKMKYSIVHPTQNIQWLNKEYAITNYIVSNMEQFDWISQKLRSFHDIPRYYRKINLNKCSPTDISVIHNNLYDTSFLYEHLQNDSTIMEYLDTTTLPISVNTLINEIESHFDIDRCKSTNLYDIKENIFKKGLYPNIDILEQKYKDSIDIMNTIQQYFSDIINLNYSGKQNKQALVCKIHTTEKSGSYFKATKKRSEILKDALPENFRIIYTATYDGTTKYFPLNCNIKLSNAPGSDKKISNKDIDSLMLSIIKRKQDLQFEVKKQFEIFITHLQEYPDEFNTISNFVTDIDVIYNKAHIANTYNYCMPIIDVDAETAYFNAEQLRHILIEQFQTDEIYVPNDIMLGGRTHTISNQNCVLSNQNSVLSNQNCVLSNQNNILSNQNSVVSNQNGILLYGTNAVGKSCLIKSIGICVIMAQSGFFVPCSKFIYKPFDQIFTRILGNDNIFKGLSTFAVEMSELNSILRFSTENSLILGDELCSGTELGSAISIFSAGLIHLSEKNTKFIFATHFHEIASMEEITTIETLKMKHMSVTYDAEEDMLIYNRILTDGPGSNSYGLEVCKSLHLPHAFLELAHSIRRKKNSETKPILMCKKSHFNAKKIQTKCEICHKECIEVHHLDHQKYANKKGFIKHFHKNHKGNLVNVCESCHSKFHSNPKKKYKRKKTTKGNKILEA